MAQPKSFVLIRNLDDRRKAQFAKEDVLGVTVQRLSLFVQRSLRTDGRFFFRGVELGDPSKRLGDLGVTLGDTIDFRPFGGVAEQRATTESSAVFKNGEPLEASMSMVFAASPSASAISPQQEKQQRDDTSLLLSPDENSVRRGGGLDASSSFAQREVVLIRNAADGSTIRLASQNLAAVTGARLHHFLHHAARVQPGSFVLRAKNGGREIGRDDRLGDVGVKAMDEILMVPHDGTASSDEAASPLSRSLDASPREAPALQARIAELSAELDLARQAAADFKRAADAAQRKQAETESELRAVREQLDIERRQRRGEQVRNLEQQEQRQRVQVFEERAMAFHAILLASDNGLRRIGDRAREQQREQQQQQRQRERSQRRRRLPSSHAAEQPPLRFLQFKQPGGSPSVAPAEPSSVLPPIDAMRVTVTPSSSGRSLSASSSMNRTTSHTVRAAVAASAADDRVRGGASSPVAVAAPVVAHYAAPTRSSKLRLLPEDDGVPLQKLPTSEGREHALRTFFERQARTHRNEAHAPRTARRSQSPQRSPDTARTAPVVVSVIRPQRYPRPPKPAKWRQLGAASVQAAMLKQINRVYRAPLDGGGGGGGRP